MQTATQESTSLQTSLQRAMLSANQKDVVKAAAPTPAASNVSTLKSIVCRRDILGNALVFDVDSHVKTPDGEFIDFWDGKGTGMKTAPLAYYKVSKPMPQADAAKLSETYAKAMKLTTVHLRQRLVKEQAAQRAEDGSISAADLSDYKLKLKAAFIKALDKALEEM